MVATGGQQPDPTPRDRQQARAEGRVAFSREVVFALIFPVTGLSLWWRGAECLRAVKTLLQTQLATAFDTQPQQMSHACQQLIVQFLMLATPILGVICGAAILGHWLQHGPLWIPSRVVPDWQRIQPASGWQRLQHRGLWVTTLLGGLRTAALTGVLLAVLWSSRHAILGLAAAPVPSLPAAGGTLLFRVAAGLAMALLIVAAIDFAYRLWLHEGRLRSDLQQRQEVKAVQNDLGGRRR